MQEEINEKSMTLAACVGKATCDELRKAAAYKTVTTKAADKDMRLPPKDAPLPRCRA